MQTEGEGFAVFRSVWRALVPSTGQFGDMGHVLTLSTPLWPSGWFHQLCEAAETGADQETFHVHRPTWEMNPNITRESVAQEFVSDPDGAAAECGAEFVSGLGAFLDSVDVYGCRRQGGVLSPHQDVSYTATIDPAFARDKFALGVAHHEADRVPPRSASGERSWGSCSSTSTGPARAGGSPATSIYRVVRPLGEGDGVRARPHGLRRGAITVAHDLNGSPCPASQ